MIYIDINDIGWEPYAASWMENNINTAQISKAEGVEHWTDALRYAIEYLFPVRASTKATSSGFMF